MQITFNTESTELKNRIADAFCSVYNYQTKVTVNGELVDNPESKNQFVQRKIKEYVKEIVKSCESSSAMQAAREEAITKADNEVTL